MSLQLAAQHMASRGRGPDTQLVHMAPREVAGLHALAKAHGGELTIKPDQIYTKHTIQASKEIKGICTGIVKQKNTELLKKESTNKK